MDTLAVRIEHPDEFKTGSRVLLLKARHKDGTIGKERAVQRATNSVQEFNSKLEELYEMMRPGERIYATANARSIKRAARLFSERMNDALHDPEPVKMNFYENLPNRWYSCLMKPESVDRNSTVRWMWDCDDVQTYKDVMSFARGMDGFYNYATKSGFHVLVKPYDRTKTPGGLAYPETNPLLLYGYS